MHLSAEQLERQRILDEALEGPLERAGSIVRVIPFLKENLLGLLGDFQLDLARRQPGPQPLQLKIDDPADFCAPQGIEDDDVIDAVRNSGLKEARSTSKT